jgi:hypothetical protein
VKNKLSKLHKTEAFKKARFSRVNLVVFAIIFATIGGYLIYSSFAAGTGNFQIQGTQIIDPNGNNYIPNGANVNGQDSWWSDPTVGNSTVAQANSCLPGGCPASVTGCGSSCDYNKNSLSQLITEYTAKHIVVMVELQDETGIADSMTSTQQQAIQNWWVSVATTYKNNPYVWFNPLNEPIGGSAPTDLNNWANVYTPLVAAIRGTGAQNIVVLDGSANGQDFSVCRIPKAPLLTNCQRWKANMAIFCHQSMSTVCGVAEAVPVRRPSLMPV